MRLTPPPMIDPQLGFGAMERQDIKMAAWKRWFERPRHVVLYTLGTAGMIVAYLFGPMLWGSRLGAGEWYLDGLWLLAFAVAMLLLYLFFGRMSFARYVYAELRDRGHDVCPGCGYVLRALPSEIQTCPECGVDRPVQ